MKKETYLSKLVKIHNNDSKDLSVFPGTHQYYLTKIK